MAKTRIRCPKCDWEPDGQPYWQCHCGCVWDTFQTQARCPSCNFRHEKTQCISCDELSLHIDWYEGLDSVIDEILDAEQVPTWLRYGDVR